MLPAWGGALPRRLRLRLPPPPRRGGRGFAAKEAAPAEAEAAESAKSAKSTEAAEAEAEAEAAPEWERHLGALLEKRPGGGVAERWEWHAWQLVSACLPAAAAGLGGAWLLEHLDAPREPPADEGRRRAEAAAAAEAAEARRAAELEREVRRQVRGLAAEVGELRLQLAALTAARPDGQRAGAVGRPADAGGAGPAPPPRRRWWPWRWPWGPGPGGPSPSPSSPAR